MPMYPYRCPDCSHEFEVLAKISEIDHAMINCEKCDTLLESKHRQIAKRQFFYGTEVEDYEFCPALGQVVKNKKHRQQIAKDRGMVEIGNESPETVHSHFESERKAQQDKRDADMTHEVMSALQ